MGTNTGKIEVWDSTTCKLVRRMTGHESRVGTMAWSSTLLASGSRDRNIYLQDVRIRSGGGSSSSRRSSGGGSSSSGGGGDGHSRDSSQQGSAHWQHSSFTAGVHGSHITASHGDLGMHDTGVAAGPEDGAVDAVHAEPGSSGPGSSGWMRSIAERLSADPLAADHDRYVLPAQATSPAASPARAGVAARGGGGGGGRDIYQPSRASTMRASYPPAAAGVNDIGPGGVSESAEHPPRRWRFIRPGDGSDSVTVASSMSSTTGAGFDALGRLSHSSIFTAEATAAVTERMSDPFRLGPGGDGGGGSGGAGASFLGLSVARALTRMGSTPGGGGVGGGGAGVLGVQHGSRRDVVCELTAHKQEVCGLKWSFDERLLASGGNDNKLFVWDAALHAQNSMASSRAAAGATASSSVISEPLCRFEDHTAAVKAVAWSPHQHGLLASGGGTADRHIRFWNANTSVALHKIDTGSQVLYEAGSELQMGAA